MTYALTLAFIGETRAKALNKTHRNKNIYTKCTLLSPRSNTGEIYITPLVARKEAKKYYMTVHGYIGYLFIHGLLHLKGYDHGDTMEEAEQKYVRKFKLR